MNRIGVGKEVVEPIAGDLRDLEQCGGVLLVLAVAQPLAALLDDPVERLRVPDRDDQREAEPLPVGLGDLRQLVAVRVRPLSD
jgi:hypothetical protein